MGLTKCSTNEQYPNIIFILADDLGYGDLGCYNEDSKIPTPNIDKLASAGMMFTDAHSPSTVCSPTRYALLTGRYAWREPRLVRGVLRNTDTPVIDIDQLTVADMLKESGYKTAAIGKWHLGLEWQLLDTTKSVSVANIDWSKPQLSGLREQGFDYSFSLGWPGWTFTENNIALAVPDVRFNLDSIGIHLIGGSNIRGFRASDYSHEKMLPTFTEKALGFIRSASAGDSPFFLYFSPMSPHKPVVPNKQFKGSSDAGLYGDFVNELDYSVGLIMQELENLNISDNTLIILSSDNGPEKTAYERILNTGHYSMDGLRGVKRDLWEGGHRVPFIVRWPERVKVFSKNDEAICLVDFIATVAEITGYDIEEGEAEDSFSFLNLLDQKQGKDIQREPIVHHSTRGDHAIRQGEWVYIDAPTGDVSNEPVWFRNELGVKKSTDEFELFNLVEDPKETNNMYSARPEKAKELKEKLESIRAGKY
ncbi:MAG: sulfatase-like hydrolase/transferase [Deltaproteobacteria bacterium]|nr:sulfatase-like hydrolase/transferase [Deltaproteobacteria bacterium]